MSYFQEHLFDEFEVLSIAHTWAKIVGMMANVSNNDFFEDEPKKYDSTCE